ncbi:MAG: sigma-54 dependent transcriptional regulator [Desulfobacterales bacterium]|nr:sigma-54 dependent transcriptional regulator [Desulfobacterales bacterium]
MVGKILVIDDEKDMLLLIERIITDETAHEVTTESDPVKALELFESQPFDLVISDLKMPKIGGIALLEKIKKMNPKVSVIMMTAYATIDTAVEATRKGAHDYISKPFKRERILVTIEQVMKWQKMLKENDTLREALADQNCFSSLIGSTPVMKEIFERIRQVSPTMGTVLITGASGTGKELVAKAIHRHSQRCTRKLITINCTAIPENVLESELFGHIKGAFTGAWKDKKGLVEEAHEGTLFLDEIGDLSLLMQTKLLRLLQEGEYKPVGSVTTKKADLRFIAATNCNLKTAIKEKTFREDLYYRLNVINFELPSLNERKQDIPILSHHFLKKYARLYQKDIREISPEAMQAIMSNDFPGNVRELENTIERGVIYCRTQMLEVKDLFLENEDIDLQSDLSSDFTRLTFHEAKDRVTHMFHKQYIESLLRENAGNVSKAAEKAGIKRQYLHRLMKDVDIDGNSIRSLSGQNKKK